MKTVIENGKIRKIEYSRGEKEFHLLKQKFEIKLGAKIDPNVIAHDVIKDEYSGYFKSLNGVKHNDDCVLVSLKLDNKTRKTRTKAYYIGNTLDVECEQNVFMTGIYDDNGEYTLYFFKDGATHKDESVWHGMSYKDYYGKTYTKDGKFIRESRYTNETSIL